MGVPGLLPALKDVARPAHISTFAGSAVAVDAYCWLHKGSYSCARELCEGVHTVAYVHYCMDRVECMLRAGVRPVIVFDGGRLPAKAAEEASRHRNRADALARARAHAASGNEAAALDCYRRAVDISPAVAMRFAAALRARGVPFLVAPYEADAQMAYLARRGDVAAVVTEDSDLLPYGCPAVFFKMDRGGHGVLVRAADFPAARALPLAGFDTAMLQEACALAGCDFVPGLPGIGVRTAAAHMKRHRSAGRVIRALRLGGKTAIPPGFEAAHARAVWTFRHQRVFCPTDRRVVHVTPLPPGGLALPDGTVLGGGGGGEGEGGEPGARAERGEGGEDDGLAFLGPPLPAGLAAAIAEGRVDPITHEPFPAHVLSGGARPPAARPPAQQHQAAGRFTFAAAARGGTAAAAAAARAARPLPVAANGVAALFARHLASGGGVDAAFVPPRRATVAGGEDGDSAGSGPHSRATPAERAAVHGPGGWGSQPPDGLWGRRTGAGGSSAGHGDASRPLALSGPAATAVVGGSEHDPPADGGGGGGAGDDDDDAPLEHSPPPSPAALERALAEERAPFAACFAAVAAATARASGEAGGGGTTAAAAATDASPADDAAAAAAPPADGPRWGATPAGWRDFYADSPAGGGGDGDENVAPRAGGGCGGGGGHGGRRSAHFPAGSGATPPPKRPAFGSPPPGPVPFGGLDHVATATAAAAAAVGRPPGAGGGKKKKGKLGGGGGGGGGGAPPLPPPARAAFAQFAFGNNKPGASH